MATAMVSALPDCPQDVACRRYAARPGRVRSADSRARSRGPPRRGAKMGIMPKEEREDPRDPRGPLVDEAHLVDSDGPGFFLEVVSAQAEALETEPPKIIRGTTPSSRSPIRRYDGPTSHQDQPGRSLRHGDRRPYGDHAVESTRRSRDGAPGLTRSCVPGRDHRTSRRRSEARAEASSRLRTRTDAKVEQGSRRSTRRTPSCPIPTSGRCNTRSATTGAFGRPSPGAGAGGGGGAGPIRRLRVWCAGRQRLLRIPHDRIRASATLQRVLRRGPERL